MSGNFWHSSHCQQWILEKQDLLRGRGSDIKILGEDDYQKLIIFFANLIQAIGEQLKVRQQVIATATVYFKRFYATNSLRCVDPLLMVPTCVFLASKVEEFGLISPAKLTQACQSVVKNKFSHAWKEFPFAIGNIHEAEFFLLEMMDCCLIVYHPYRPLLQFVKDIHSTNDSLLSVAWRICNDSLRTDVALLFPPYQIALASLHMASVMCNVDLKQWFAELSVEMDKVFDIEKYIMTLYQLWKTFDEKKDIAPLIQRLPRPQS